MGHSILGVKSEQALETYLQYRIQRGIGTVLGSGPYRSLLPHQPLIYSSRGDGMSQNTKRRVLETGQLYATGPATAYRPM